MNVAVCFNRVPPTLLKGEESDRLSEEGAEQEALAVQQALSGLGHAVALLPIADDLVAALFALRASRPDVVFNLCEGFWGDSRREMHVAAALELLGCPVTGAPPLCLGLTQDKARTKDLFARHGLPTPPYLVVAPGTPLPPLGGLNFPLIVKPRAEDASLGITEASIVEDSAALARQVRYVHAAYRQDALVEEFIDGREINAAVLGNFLPEVLPFSEIRFRPGLTYPIVSYDGKWREDSAAYLLTEPVCPAILADAEALRIAEVARRAYDLCGCRDYARVDVRLRDGIPYVLEVNANPDISPGAGLARAAGAAGLDYPTLIERILTLAADRKETAHAASA